MKHQTRFRIDGALDRMKTAMLDFDNHNLSVGNKILDYTHKELLNIVSWMNHLIDVDDPHTLLDAIDLFENRLNAYFANEESIAQAVGFDFAEHKLSHQYLMEVFGGTCLKNKGWLMTENGALPKIEVKKDIDFLKNCLVQHIKKDSKPLKIILDTQFYTFAPPGLSSPTACA